jgi:hypothetical protein
VAALFSTSNVFPPSLATTYALEVNAITMTKDTAKGLLMKLEHRCTTMKVTWRSIATLLHCARATVRAASAQATCNRGALTDLEQRG